MFRVETRTNAIARFIGLSLNQPILSFGKSSIEVGLIRLLHERPVLLQN